MEIDLPRPTADFCKKIDSSTVNATELHQLVLLSRFIAFIIIPLIVLCCKSIYFTVRKIVQQTPIRKTTDVQMTVNTLDVKL